VKDLNSLISRVKKWMSKTVTLKYPTTLSKEANAQEVKVGVLSALLGEMSARIIEYPEDRQWRTKFERIEKERTDLIREISKQQLESKMKFLVDGVQRCSKDFFRITGKMMARDKFSSSCKSNMSDDEKEKKLKDNDETFINREENFTDDNDDFMQINPERVYTLKGW